MHTIVLPTLRSLVFEPAADGLSGHFRFRDAKGVELASVAAPVATVDVRTQIGMSHLSNRNNPTPIAIIRPPRGPQQQESYSDC